METTFRFSIEYMIIYSNLSTLTSVLPSQLDIFELIVRFQSLRQNKKIRAGEVEQTLRQREESILSNHRKIELEIYENRCSDDLVHHFPIQTMPLICNRASIIGRILIIVVLYTLYNTNTTDITIYISCSWTTFELYISR